MSGVELSERKLKILSVIINSYIKNGEPVSSKNLCNILDTNLSSATLRNEMAELTELGFLEQPHTSAGRVPSYLGYRLYINKLMGRRNVSKKTKEIVDSSLNFRSNTPENLLSEVSKVLAGITNLAVVSTTTFSDGTTVKRIHFVKIGKDTAMVLLTVSSGIVKNKFFRCSYEITDRILDVYCSTLNEKFVGVAISSITAELMYSISNSFGTIQSILNDALFAFYEAAQDVLKTEVHLGGETNLLFLPEFRYSQALKIIDFLTHAGYVERLISHTGNSITVMVGKENSYEELMNSSTITTRYFVNGKEFGTIGVVGPTRMDYASLIADIEYTAMKLGTLLGNILGNE